jgi:hypothetical protein
MRRHARKPILNWREAEFVAEAWMRSPGFRDARITGGVADAGIDGNSRAAFAQVKFQAGAVGRSDLQRLFGARAKLNKKKMLFFSLSGYSTKAVQYADEVGMALFSMSRARAIMPVNSQAVRMGRRRSWSVPHETASSLGQAAAVQRPRLIKPARQKGAIRWVKRYWRIVIGSMLIIAPFGTLSDPGPLWLRLLKFFGGVALGVPCGVALILWHVRRNRGVRIPDPAS